MANWREIKGKALGDIHRAFQIPAVYLTHAAGTPVRVNVRLHQRQAASNIQVGDFLSGAVSLDLVDRIIVDQCELRTVLHNAYFVFGPTEAYLSGPSKPARASMLWVEVSEVATADLARLLADTDTNHPAWEGILP